LGLWAKDNAANISLLELEFVVVGPNGLQGLPLNNLQVQSMVMGGPGGGGATMLCTVPTACGNTCGATCGATCAGASCNLNMCA
jgi:hypothetical protein